MYINSSMITCDFVEEHLMILRLGDFGRDFESVIIDERVTEMKLLLELMLQFATVVNYRS